MLEYQKRNSKATRKKWVKGHTQMKKMQNVASQNYIQNDRIGLRFFFRPHTICNFPSECISSHAMRSHKTPTCKVSMSAHRTALHKEVSVQCLCLILSKSHRSCTSWHLLSMTHRRTLCLRGPGRVSMRLTAGPPYTRLRLMRPPYIHHWICWRWAPWTSMVALKCTHTDITHSRVCGCVHKMCTIK